MIDKLNNDDLEILIQALDSWTNDGQVGLVMSSMIGSILSKDHPEAKIEVEIEKRTRSYEDKKRQKERKATMLKAKLMQIQDALMQAPSDFDIKQFIES